ncbi:MAG: acyl-CoA thioesterase [Myxococcales bacterium]|nr:acyl-CoA thioesterase [Myxococcales bacterium]
MSTAPGAASPAAASPDVEAPTFTLCFDVRDEDIDALGHASNIAYVRWIQDVAKAHSEAVGWDHARYLELGALFVVRRHEIDYLRSAFASDSLVATTQIHGFKAATCRRHTRIHRVADGIELARAVTTWALVSAEDGRPKRIPPAIHEAFARPPATEPRRA